MSQQSDAVIPPNPYLYLTTTGHRTGQPHEIEIWYVERGGLYYLVSEHRDRAHWVRNLRREPRVTLRVNGIRYAGQARVVDPAAEPELAADVTALMDAKYGWSDGLIVELTPGERIDA